MKYLLTLIITLLSITSFSQKNIYVVQYPLNAVFTGKVGADSMYNFFISQAHLDSLKALFDTAKNQTTRINAANISISATNAQLTITSNNLSATGATVSNHSLQLAAQANQISSSQVNIAKNTADITALQQSTGTKPLPRTIITSTYQIISSDNGGTLLFPNKCTITLSTSIQMPFECTIIQQGVTNSGQVQFSGINTNSGTNWKRVKFQYGKVQVTETSTGIFNLNGDLKL